MPIEFLAALVHILLTSLLGAAALTCAIWMIDYGGPKMYPRLQGLASFVLFVGFVLGGIAGGRGMGELPALTQVGIFLSAFFAAVGLLCFFLSFSSYRRQQTQSGIVGDV